MVGNIVVNLTFASLKSSFNIHQIYHKETTFGLIWKKSTVLKAISLIVGRKSYLSIQHELYQRNIKKILTRHTPEIGPLNNSFCVCRLLLFPIIFFSIRQKSLGQYLTCTHLLTYGAIFIQVFHWTIILDGEKIVNHSPTKWSIPLEHLCQLIGPKCYVSDQSNKRTDH